MIEIPADKRGNIVSDLMPDLTPLLDVMFMLIVFFLLTANAVPYTLDVNLPEDKEKVAQAVEDPNMLSPLKMLLSYKQKTIKKLLSLVIKKYQCKNF